MENDSSKNFTNTGISIHQNRFRINPSRTKKRGKENTRVNTTDKYSSFKESPRISPNLISFFFANHMTKKEGKNRII